MSRISLSAWYTVVKAHRFYLSVKAILTWERCDTPGQAPQGILLCTMKIYLGFTVAGSRSSIEAAKKILTFSNLWGMKSSQATW